MTKQPHALGSLEWTGCQSLLAVAHCRCGWRSPALRTAGQARHAHQVHKGLMQYRAEKSARAAANIEQTAA